MSWLFKILTLEEVAKAIVPSFFFHWYVLNKLQIQLMLFTHQYLLKKNTTINWVHHLHPMRLISISQAITKWRNFTSSNLLKDWEVLAKHHSNLYSKDSTSISEQIKETPPNVEKTSSSYVCQLQVLFVYPCSILFPPQSSMHLPKFFSAAS